MLAHTVLLLGPFHGRVEDCGRQNGQKEPVLEKFQRPASCGIGCRRTQRKTLILLHLVIWSDHGISAIRDSHLFGHEARVGARVTGLHTTRGQLLLLVKCNDCTMPFGTFSLWDLFFSQQNRNPPESRKIGAFVQSCEANRIWDPCD